MTDQEIQVNILLGWPFFGITSQGLALACYDHAGPVYVWADNCMILAELQGEELIYSLHLDWGERTP